ncbi:hypothetical protein CV729_04485 [Helicobacter pylori]|nr:hypothetical protein CV729_04485 [Helicobacter pylori]
MNFCVFHFLDSLVLKCCSRQPIKVTYLNYKTDFKMGIVYFKVVCNKGKFGVIKWRIVISLFKKYHIGRKILN